MFYLVILVFIVIGLTLKRLNKSKISIENRHVVITGGSSGIGKALGMFAAEQGAHVTILARSYKKLEEAQAEILKHCVSTSQKIQIVSVDVVNQADISEKLRKLDSDEPIFMLVNCAGLAICGTIEDMSEKDIKHLIDVNLLGSVFATQAVVPLFKQRREGRVVITASAVALMGMYGYSIYSACKFALRGFAESIHMELKPYNVGVTLALPPDTDTPGFENENKSKPEETKLISESGGIYQPEVVANQILGDALKGRFFSYVGVEGFTLTTLCMGMSPFQSIFEILTQSLLIGPLRLIGAFYLTLFDRIVLKCYKAKQLKQD